MTGPSGKGRDLGAHEVDDGAALDAAGKGDTMATRLPGDDGPSATTPPTSERRSAASRGAPLRAVRPSDEHDDRPTIRIEADALPRMVRGAVAALAARDSNIYQRAGALVSIVREPSRSDGSEYEADERRGATIAVRPGTPTIVEVGSAALRVRLAQVARWEKFDGRRGAASDDGKRAGAWVPATVDSDTAAAVADPTTLGSWPGIKPIDSIAEAPFMRADGTIVQSPGYDAPSAVVYVPSVEFPRVPDAPTRDDAARALAELRDVFREFPFRDGADCDVPIAAVLTLLARPAILGSVPMFLLDATTRASGKSLLADCVATIATGRSAPRMTWASDEEEQQKVLASYALLGAPLVCFDNVTAPICGAALDKVLTATDRVDLRVLGRSQLLSLPWRAVVLATGNNIVVKGDTERRVLAARLEPTCENPEEREGFAHPDLLAWVRAERPRLVAAALTILRAYAAAGRPSMGLRQWGSFEAWTALVPAALVYAGAANVLEARPTMRGEGDPEKAALMTILDALPRLCSDPMGITVRSIVALLYSMDRMRGEAPPDGFDDLRDALETLAPARSGQGVDSTRLGFALRRMRGRWVGGRQLESLDGRAGTVRWRVVVDRPARSERAPVAAPPAPPAVEPAAVEPAAVEPVAADLVRLIPALDAADLATLTAQHNDPAVRAAARDALAARLAAERGGPS